MTIGNGGTVTLDCANGGYNANTRINGGTLIVKQPGAIAGSKGIFFDGAGTLTLDRVTLGNDIYDFGSGDSVQLVGVSANDDYYSLGRLTLYDNGESVATLNFFGSQGYTASNFVLTGSGAPRM